MANTDHIKIRGARPNEHAALGELMVAVYSKLAGFPSPAEQPKYYSTLANIGVFTKKEGAKVLVAVTGGGEILGGVVYFGNMKNYGADEIATDIPNASGLRLLAVSHKARGMGIGRALTQACINLAKCNGHSSVFLHSTKAMKVAWRMYEKMGFERFPELDFRQQGFPVFGFRLAV